MSVTIETGGAVLVDSVTGLVLSTPLFTDYDEADAFQRWTEREKGIIDIRQPGESEMLSLAREWMTLMADHDEAVCPFDRDVSSYGVGFTGDSDKGGQMSTPDACGCECHDKPGASRSEAQKGRF